MISMELSLRLDNGSFERLATLIELAEDREDFVKKLFADRQLVLDLIKKEDR